MVCPDLALICRSAGLADLHFWWRALQSDCLKCVTCHHSFFFASLSNLQRWRLVELFTKVRTALIEVGQYFAPSFFVRLSFALDIHWIIVVLLDLHRSSDHDPPFCHVLATILDIRLTGFTLVCCTRPVVPLPHHGHHITWALLSRLTLNVDY